MTTLEQIEALAEEYRQKLGLKPWADFEREVLAKWDSDQHMTHEARENHKKAKRRCGKSTKALLFSLAEAMVTGKPLLICGASKSATRIMHNRAVDLAESLRINVTIEMFPRQVVMLSESYF